MSELMFRVHNTTENKIHTKFFTYSDFITWVGDEKREGFYKPWWLENKVYVELLKIVSEKTQLIDDVLEWNEEFEMYEFFFKDDQYMNYDLESCFHLIWGKICINHTSNGGVMVKDKLIERREKTKLDITIRGEKYISITDILKKPLVDITDKEWDVWENSNLETDYGLWDFSYSNLIEDGVIDSLEDEFNHWVEVV